MGALCYFINHTLKEYFCPYTLKFGELVGSLYFMAEVLDFIRNCWNNCQIEISSSYGIEKLEQEHPNEYKESKLWEDWIK